ncbi:TatD family hydrolase [Lentisphaerota bacterium WC36G]|nr:TatD family hydrolase [Lentisphaerae bacterium WC36]
MQLFDSHFHYYNKKIDKKTKQETLISPQEYFESIKSDELKYMLCCGGNLATTLMSQQFAEEIPNSYFAAGVHPHEAGLFAKKFENNISLAVAEFQQFIGHEKLVAVGEIGLDYFYEHSERKVQCAVLEGFLEFALENNLPAIIHCRDRDETNNALAYKDAYSLLSDFKQSNGRFEVHCFAGTPHWCDEFLALDAMVGISGIITFPKAQNIRELLPLIPDERLLIETDSPYLAPIPYRGKENKPSYVIEVARKIAEEKAMNLEDVVELTTKNALSFFKIEK